MFALTSLLVLPACAKWGLISGLNLEPYTPKVSFNQLKILDVDFKRIDTRFVLDVENPNPLEIKAASLTWDLDLDGRSFLSGALSEGLSLNARQTSKVTIDVSTKFKAILDTFTGLQGQDSIPFKLSGKIGFNTPLGEIKVPYKAQGEFPVLRPPKIGIKGLRMGKINLFKQTASLDLDLTMTHDQGSTMSFDHFDYGITLGKTEVVSGNINNMGTVAAGKTEVITLPIDVNLLQMGTVVVEAINGRGDMNVGIGAQLDVGTPFGVIPFTFDDNGKFGVSQ